MSPFERAADRWDARSRSCKASRARLVRHAQLMVDIGYALSAALVALRALPNWIVQTPSGPMPLHDITGHIARLQHRLAQTRSRVRPVTSFELAAALEAMLDEDGPCTAEAREKHPDAIGAARLLDRWNGLGTAVRSPSPPPVPAATEETS